MSEPFNLDAVLGQDLALTARCPVCRQRFAGSRDSLCPACLSYVQRCIAASLHHLVFEQVDWGNHAASHEP